MSIKSLKLVVMLLFSGPIPIYVVIFHPTLSFWCSLITSYSAEWLLFVTFKKSDIIVGVH